MDESGSSKLNKWQMGHLIHVQKESSRDRETQGEKQRQERWEGKNARNVKERDGKQLLHGSFILPKIIGKYCALTYIANFGF